MSYLKKYEYVIALAKLRSVSQAAESLGVSQPTFSKYLKKIESELGIELFDRSTIPLSLTKAGQVFLERGKQLIDIDKQIQKEIEEIKTGHNLVIRVGISPSRSPYMMPDIVKSYREKFPHSRIEIEERTTKELNKHLAEGNLDLVISLLDEETQNFNRIELFDESIMLAVAKGASDEYANAREVLKNTTLISVGKGQAMWKIMKDVAQELDLGEPQIECQSIESALSLVKNGIGAMIVPSYIATKENENVRFLPITTKVYYRRKVCVFYRKEQFLSQAEKIFIDCVIQKERIKKEI